MSTDSHGASQLVYRRIPWHSGVVPTSTFPPGSRMPFDVGDRSFTPTTGPRSSSDREAGVHRRCGSGVPGPAPGLRRPDAPGPGRQGRRGRPARDHQRRRGRGGVRRPAQEGGAEPTNWSRRFKNHVEKLKSGDIYQVAEVVRNLSLREKDKGLSAGEKRMLTKARQILVSELTFAVSVAEETEAALDEALP